MPEPEKLIPLHGGYRKLKPTRCTPSVEGNLLLCSFENPCHPWINSGGLPSAKRVLQSRRKSLK